MIASTIKLFLVVVAAAAGGAVCAQAAPENAPAEPEQRLLERIDELRSEGGPTAEGLIEPLRALALLSQESGDHALAVVALQEARHITRVRRGFSATAIDQAQLLRQQIVSEKALGNSERVWNFQQELLKIAREHIDDLRMLPIFVELIDDRTELLEEFSTTDFLDLRPGLYVPCAPPARGPGPPSERVVASDARACPFGSWRVVVDRLNAEILTHYAEAIEVLVRNGDYASRQLRDLEKAALRLVPFSVSVTCSSTTVDQLLVARLVGSCLEPLGYFGAINVGGWVSLMRLLAYEIRSDAPAGTRAVAFAELADWYLQFAHLDQRSFNATDETALVLYRRGFGALGQGAEARESLELIFSPDLPVTLPAYAPNALASTESSRYIDVAFAITEHGEAEQIEITRSENATGGEERGLVRLIKYTSFRPRAVGGELAASAPVAVRYYLPERLESTAVSAR